MEQMKVKDYTLERQPKATDPKEQRIRKVLEEELLSTPWAREAREKSRELQKDFLKESLVDFNNPGKILQEYRALLKKLGEINQVHVVDGQDIVDEYKKEKAFIVVTNHLGLAKITRIPMSELGLSIELEEVEPFPIRPIAASTTFNNLVRFHESAIELPDPLNKVQETTGAILVSAGGSGRTEKLIDDVNETITYDKESLVVMYPEGGTTGKYNETGPYDLDKFHKGAFVVGATLNLPIVPVCQVFDPNEGLKVGVLEPVILGEKDLDKIDEVVIKVQESMQDWLDKHKP